MVMWHALTYHMTHTIYYSMLYATNHGIVWEEGQWPLPHSNPSVSEDQEMSLCY